VQLEKRDPITKALGNKAAAMESLPDDKARTEHITSAIPPRADIARASAAKSTTRPWLSTAEIIANNIASNPASFRTVSATY
jgi:hypothetical protein